MRLFHSNPDTDRWLHINIQYANHYSCSTNKTFIPVSVWFVPEVALVIFLPQEMLLLLFAFHISEPILCLAGGWMNLNCRCGVLCVTPALYSVSVWCIRLAVYIFMSFSPEGLRKYSHTLPGILICVILKCDRNRVALANITGFVRLNLFNIKRTCWI